MAEGVSEIEELNKVLEKAVTLRNMLKNRDRVAKVAAYIADHFTSTIEPMGYKAFVVTVDREACCLMKDAIDQHLEPEASAVVISPGGKKDSDLLHRYWLTDDQEKTVRLRARFRGHLRQSGKSSGIRFTRRDRCRPGRGYSPESF